jgi:hypothetical protein
MDNSTKGGTSGNASTVTADEGVLVDHLVDEYKILQDKIDKIGAFRFMIKGWSITVIIAALFAGTTTNAVRPLLWLLCLFVVLALFCYVEKTQTDLSHYFGERTISIETVVSRILRKSARSSGNNAFVLLRWVPGIAHHLGRQHPKREGPRSRWQSLRDADIYFYLIQAVVVLAVVLLHNSGRDPSRNQVIVINGGDASTQAPERSGGAATKDMSSESHSTNGRAKDVNKSGVGSDTSASKRAIKPNEKSRSTGQENTKQKSD